MDIKSKILWTYCEDVVENMVENMEDIVELLWIYRVKYCGNMWWKIYIVENMVENMEDCGFSHGVTISP